MNIKLRVKNPTVVLAIISAVLTAVYSIATTLGYEAPIDQEQIIVVVNLVLSLLTGLGILVDPTTKGISDSDRAMNYNKPN